MFKFRYLFILLIPFLFAACSSSPTADDPDEEEEVRGDGFKDLVVPEGFDFKLIKDVNLEVEITLPNGSPFEDAVFDLYLTKSSLQASENRLIRFRTNAQGKFTTKIPVPTYYDSIYLKPLSPGFTSSYEVRITDDLASFKFYGANPGNSPLNTFDEYPGDPDRMYNNYFPGENKFGTILFEDLWPGYGDFDFNDVVLDYNINEVTNNTGQIVEFVFDLKLRATCATFVNGFGIELPFPSANVSSVTGTRLTTGVITTTNSGLEAGHTEKSVVIPFDNAQLELGALSNCYATAPSVPEDSFLVRVQLAQPISRAELSLLAPYNPFIFIDTIRSWEIHPPNFSPTALVDATRFGSSRDNTRQFEDIFYLSEDNLPWGLIVPESIPYTKVNVPIHHGFRYFQDWAESSGTLRRDWYMNKTGYRAVEQLY